MPLHQHVPWLRNLSNGDTRQPTPWGLAGCPWWVFVSFWDPTWASTTEKLLTNQAEKEVEALRSGNISLRIHAWQRMSMLLPSVFCWIFCEVTSCFYTTANISWGMKDHCHIPAPHFHCKPKYSLIKISEKSWDGAGSGEFKDQKRGEIPISQAILKSLLQPF